MNENHLYARPASYSAADLQDVHAASTRLAQHPDDVALSASEEIAAAFLNGRMDIIEAQGGMRKALIELGPDWSHAMIDVLFHHYQAEMSLRPGDPGHPIGDQRILTND